MNKLTCRQQRYFYVILTIAIVLLAINMRAPIIGFGALSHLIQDELGLSTRLLGIFGAIPMIAFGLSSFIAPKIAQKIGIETTLILASVLLALGVLGRGMGGVAVLMAGTVLLSFAISLGNVIIPAAIKKHAHNHTSQITALYSTALSGFAGLSAVILIPLSDVIGWRLASFGVMAILAAVFWFMIRQRQHPSTAKPLACAHTKSLALQNGMGNQLIYGLTIIFVLQLGIVFPHDFDGWRHAGNASRLCGVVATNNVHSHDNFAVMVGKNRQIHPSYRHECIRYECAWGGRAAYFSKSMAVSLGNFARLRLWHCVYIMLNAI